MNKLEIAIFLKDGAKMPAKATIGSAGLDICANESVLLKPGVTTPISTGVYLAIPHGYECQVRSRSGLASKGVVVANSPGTIDSDYRGEVKVLLVSKDEYQINTGDRVAQLVIAKLTDEPELVSVTELSDLPATNRGTGGFGSTGV